VDEVSGERPKGLFEKSPLGTPKNLMPKTGVFGKASNYFSPDTTVSGGRSFLKIIKKLFFKKVS